MEWGCPISTHELSETFGELSETSNDFIDFQDLSRPKGCLRNPPALQSHVYGEMCSSHIASLYRWRS